jgi:predicted AAA+ superfamily ATPase
MNDNLFRLSFPDCFQTLSKRLKEPAPGRIQLLAGPRQVGKTTLLEKLAGKLGRQAMYAAVDAPGSSLPGFLERIFSNAEQTARTRGAATVLLDEAHLLHDWSATLKSFTDYIHREKLPIHIVATGSSSLRLAAGSRESLAGRFERLTMAHWSASTLSRLFNLPPVEAAQHVVCLGSYPGAVSLRNDRARYIAYIRDAIVEPAIGKDILVLAAIRRPALLRQVFELAISSPATILSLQKMQGQLQDRGTLETIAHYLNLLEEAFLVAALQKYSTRSIRRRASSPKLITLNNALLAAIAPHGPPDPDNDPALFGSWVENACLAHAWNSGQHVMYWREEPLEVDGVIEGSWGAWAVEVKTGRVQPSDLQGLFEFTRRYPKFKPLVIAEKDSLPALQRTGAMVMTWQDFLLGKPS